MTGCLSPHHNVANSPEGTSASRSHCPLLKALGWHHSLAGQNYWTSRFRRSRRLPCYRCPWSCVGTTACSCCDQVSFSIGKRSPRRWSFQQRCFLPKQSSQNVPHEKKSRVHQVQYGKNSFYLSYPERAIGRSGLLPKKHLKSFDHFC